ncbi:hypothetical protein OG819_42865 [Streptomyces sp. NBC_01549]|uniref:hypothetical protein n=1 Tax=Streptomyces sp. NBC_01549 TaxID=2975874 RepID=UPI0022502405|nr:hypothetical protein [Streptomyces sp. NBC_01549]MCX4596160.1 hypothetical protein [Streptomyces sp. NBC_01549]
MARIRSIKPEMRTSITVSLWPREVRYFFILLWGYLDDYGRGVDDELLIASDCFPRDRDVTPEVIDGWLETIAEAGPLCRYEVDGRTYLHAPNWREHQKPSHPTRSKIPPCPDDEPDDFKRWRDVNPQRLRNRSRKSREEFAKIPETPAAPSGRASGSPSEGPFGVRVHGEPATAPDEVVEPDEDEETAAHAWYDDAPESLPNSSGDAPEYFAPEQGSKGAREQGSKGEGGVGGNGRREVERQSTPPASRSDDRPPLHELPENFALTDAMRGWARNTYPRVDVDHETDKFIYHHRDEGRRKRNWYGAWQKWIAGANQHLNKHGVTHSNVIDLASGQPLPGTDSTVSGWGAVAAALDTGDPA